MESEEVRERERRRHTRFTNHRAAVFVTHDTYLHKYTHKRTFLNTHMYTLTSWCFYNMRVCVHVEHIYMNMCANMYTYLCVCIYLCMDIYFWKKILCLFAASALDHVTH